MGVCFPVELASCQNRYPEKTIQEITQNFLPAPRGMLHGRSYLLNRNKFKRGNNVDEQRSQASARPVISVSNFGSPTLSLSVSVKCSSRVSCESRVCERISARVFSLFFYPIQDYSQSKRTRTSSWINY